MAAKLTDKNLQALEKLSNVDSDLGLATPSMMLTDDAARVKSEIPSLETLQELLKTQKIS